jgi:hypothetical protein
VTLYDLDVERSGYRHAHEFDAGAAEPLSQYIALMYKTF